MNSLTRTFLPAAALAALTVLAAGCGGPQSSAAGAASSPSSPPASATASQAAASPATSAPASAPATPSATATATGASAAPTSPAAPASPTVYLAEGGSITGTPLHVPGCATDCVLSGDGTTSLSRMTWLTWNAVEAIGTGTEKLDDCTPNCAQGTLHAVAVRVALSKPVMVCVSGKSTWFWTRATFTWPSGLPAAFAGANAPTNPFDYDGIASQAAKAC